MSKTGTMADIRNATMACWWPSQNNVLCSLDWDGIAGELRGLVEDAQGRNDAAEVQHLGALLSFAEAYLG